MYICIYVYIIKYYIYSISIITSNLSAEFQATFRLLALPPTIAQREFPTGNQFVPLRVEQQRDAAELALLKAEQAPVEVGSLSHFLQGFSTIPGGWEWDF